MSWRRDLTAALKHMLWACVILAVAAYGAVVVQNVTEMLTQITRGHPANVVIERPNR